MATRSPGSPEDRSQVIRGVTATNNSQAIAVFASGDVHLPSHHTTASNDKTAQTHLEAFCLTDPKEDRERLFTEKGHRARGTCEWISENDVFKLWLEPGGNASTLWISGGPGMGKTILSTYLTEYFENKHKGEESGELAYYFCGHNDVRRNTAAAVLRGLIYQLLRRHEAWIEKVLPPSLMENKERLQNMLSSPEALWLRLLQLIECFTPPARLVLLVDGLDECDPESTKILIKRLLSLATKVAGFADVKVIIVSRDDLVGLGALPRIRLDVEQQNLVKDDIGRFIEDRVDELSKQISLDANFRAWIRSRLVAKAEGTFLWVGFAIQELQKQASPTELKKVLEDLPPGLYPMYFRMLSQIRPAQRDVTMKILTWVALAARPLTLREMAYITGSRSSEAITREQATKDAVTTCGPLLKIDEADEISFVHLSAKDHLLRQRSDTDASTEALYIEPEKAHIMLATTCLTALENWNPGRYAIALDRYDEYDPLLRYSALHWFEHAREVSQGYSLVFDLHRPFFQEHTHISECWLMFYNNFTNSSSYLHRGKSLVEIAARFHLYYLAVVATGGPDPSTFSTQLNKVRLHIRSQSKATMSRALCVACATGQLELVKLLLRRGARVNASCGYPFDLWTPLRSAYSCGDEAIIAYLVEKGATTSGESFETIQKQALLDAVTNGHLESVKQHLRKRPHLIDGAFIRAAEVRDSNMLESLYAREKSPEVINRALRNVLRSGSASAFNCLLDAVPYTDAAFYAALEAPGPPNGPPWHNDWLFSTFVMHSIAKRVDVHHRLDEGRTWLHYMASRGHRYDSREAIENLIERSANPLARDDCRRTALHVCRDAGATEVLLACGIDAGCIDDRGCTPLHYADDSDVANVLLESGADVNSLDAEGRTPLHYAALRCGPESTELLGFRASFSPATVKCLVLAGADVKIRDHSGKSPLELMKQKVQLLKMEGITHDVEQAKGSLKLMQEASRNRE